MAILGGPSGAAVTLCEAFISDRIGSSRCKAELPAKDVCTPRPSFSRRRRGSSRNHDVVHEIQSNTRDYLKAETNGGKED